MTVSTKTFLSCIWKL